MGDITLRKALDDYKTVYMPYRNFADRTRKEYQNDLEQFISFLEQLGINFVRELGLPNIERYAVALEERGYASLTRKRKIIAVRSFLSFLYQEDNIQSNLAQRTLLPFTEVTTPYVLTQKECDRLRSACAGSPRNQAVIELILQTGITLYELTHLTLDDVQFDEKKKHQRFIRIMARRGKKERLLPLNSKACFALRRYLIERRDAGNSILFLNRFGEPLGERGVQKMLRKYRKKAGIGQVSVHTLRHTFGIYHASRGMNIKVLQEVMGHKDRRSTMIYISLMREMSVVMQNNAL